MSSSVYLLYHTFRYFYICTAIKYIIVLLLCIVHFRTSLFFLLLVLCYQIIIWLYCNKWILYEFNQNEICTKEYCKLIKTLAEIFTNVVRFFLDYSKCYLSAFYLSLFVSRKNWLSLDVMIKVVKEGKFIKSKLAVVSSVVLLLHKKWCFLLKIYLVNVTKSVGNCGFGHIYWRNP